ncbi:hypothetical protein KSP39_PZI011354 [Platanthera zijinensis]|uniref:Zinc finger protein 385B n=1 Tax=Platanthera zijinensis TaxID=2320716 RepID=A0AAP0G5U2_9ASPA
MCAICNVVCNSDKVFASHLAGEKHLLKALGRKSRSMVSNLSSHTKKKAHAKVPHPQPFSLSSFIPFKPAQTFICEVCKIDCNSQEILNSHKMGKKHRSKLLKLQQAIAPKPPAPPIDKNTPKPANVEPAKMQPSPSVKEGIQVKKEKILKGGAVKDEIMECLLCDVVCNSKTVYDFHVKGKKHLATVKKRNGVV